MKNLKSFPFERNRYFYGKLLSVEDFETEQKYFNDKRRTINRFLFGSGIVCGLQVVEVDDESISLERGLALDFAGREIVVDEPIVKKIVDLEGYHSEQDNGFYYLCLNYQESAFEPMHNVAGMGENKEGEFNKYKEGYHLFITQTEPEREVFSPIQLYERSTEIYCANGIKICQILPRYLEMGSETTLRIEIENIGQQQNFSFDYELMLSFLTYQDEPRVQVHFDEKDWTKDKKYIIEIPLKVVYINNVEAEVFLVPESFTLYVGERSYHISENYTNKAHISRKDGNQTLLEEYYKNAMEYVVNHTYQQSIYLAKIYVVKTADLCLIERIEQLPFGQYILHTEISTALMYKLVEDVKKLKMQNLSQLDQRKIGDRYSEQPETACGEVTFEVKRVKQGEVIYSERIFHGLGLSPVTIILGYEVENGYAEERETIFGDASIFQNSKEDFQAFLGAKLEVSEGAFVIGMKIRKKSNIEKVVVRWTAWKNPIQRLEIQKKRLFIQPDIPNICVGESITFTTISEGFQDERIKWSVKDLDGGTIDKNGKYTAPETAGVFRISAVSTIYPDIVASTFVVVREKEEDWLR